MARIYRRYGVPQSGPATRPLPTFAVTQPTKPGYLPHLPTETLRAFQRHHHNVSLSITTNTRHLQPRVNLQKYRKRRSIQDRKQTDETADFRNLSNAMKTITCTVSRPEVGKTHGLKCANVARTDYAKRLSYPLY